jgi:hypothetical protein
MDQSNVYFLGKSFLLHNFLSFAPEIAVNLNPETFQLGRKYQFLHLHNAGPACKPEEGSKGETHHCNNQTIQA